MSSKVFACFLMGLMSLLVIVASGNRFRRAQEENQVAMETDYDAEEGGADDEAENAENAEDAEEGGAKNLERFSERMLEMGADESSSPAEGGKCKPLSPEANYDDVKAMKKSKIWALVEEKDEELKEFKECIKSRWAVYAKEGETIKSDWAAVKSKFDKLRSDSYADKKEVDGIAARIAAQKKDIKKLKDTVYKKR